MNASSNAYLKNLQSTESFRRQSSNLSTLRSARCLILRGTCALALICTPWTASLLL